MEKVETLIVTRQDLSRTNKKLVQNITLTDIAHITVDKIKAEEKFAIIIFIDNDGECNVLKNRKGKVGVIIKI